MSQGYLEQLSLGDSFVSFCFTHPNVKTPDVNAWIGGRSVKERYPQRYANLASKGRFLSWIKAIFQTLIQLKSVCCDLLLAGWFSNCYFYSSWPSFQLEKSSKSSPPHVLIAEEELLPWIVTYPFKNWWWEDAMSFQNGPFSGGKFSKNLGGNSLVETLEVKVHHTGWRLCSSSRWWNPILWLWRLQVAR